MDSNSVSNKSLLIHFPSQSSHFYWFLSFFLLSVLWKIKESSATTYIWPRLGNTKKNLHAALFKLKKTIYHHTTSKLILILFNILNSFSPWKKSINMFLKILDLPNRWIICKKATYWLSSFPIYKNFEVFCNNLKLNQLQSP